MKQLCLLLVLLFATSALAQNKIVAHNGSAAPRFYTSLDEALTNAQYDDVIYLSGGTFSTSIAINTKIRLIGVGWHPDSTKATNQTFVNSMLTVTSAGSNGSLEGLRFQGITFGNQSNGGSVTNYTIQKCLFENGQIVAYVPVNYLSVTQSIFSSFSASQQGSINNSIFANNGINGALSIKGNNNTFMNNIFFYTFYNGVWGYYHSPILAVSNSTFTNNIFRYTLGGVRYESSSQIISCTFNYNLNAEGVPNSIVNNNLNINLDNVFERGGTLARFQYDKDQNQNPYSYKLKSTFITDNPTFSNVGIFGGDLGWGTIPDNPWIYEKNISTATDANGNLRAIIKVKAKR